MKPITHHLTERQIARLRAASDQTGLSGAEIIRRALDTYLAPNKLSEADRQFVAAYLARVNEATEGKP